MESLRSIDELLARFEAENPGFHPATMRELAIAWTWEGLRVIESTNLGMPADTCIDIQGGKGELPHDFLWLNYACGIPAHVAVWRPGWNELVYHCDGPLSISYQALPTDDDGLPLVMDAAEQAVLAWWEWKYILLVQKKRWLANANVRIDSGLNQTNEIKAYNLCAEARGRLNQLTPADIERYKAIRKLRTYRNRR